MRKKRFKLDFDYSFYLMALVTVLKDYKLCWILNNKFNFNFKKSPDLKITSPAPKEISFFTCFNWKDEMENRDYYLLKNKSDETCLIPELKEVDYFIMVKGNFNEDDKKRINKQLKEVSEMQTCFEVNPEKLSSKQNLLFE